jgi:hypothetical protein
MGGDRTYDQCRIRWNGVLKVLRVKGTVVKNGPWSAAEVIFSFLSRLVADRFVSRMIS